MDIIGYKAFTAFCGIAIHSIEYGVDANKVIWTWQVNGQQEGKPHKSTIYNGDHMHLYFKAFGRREYLIDYMATGRW